MARALSLAVAAALAGLVAPAHASCTFVGGEIANPFDPTCAGNQLTYTEAQNDSTRIALGYPVPMPVASLTPVDGFRAYASLHARHQDLMLTSGGLIQGQIVGQTVAGRDIWAYRLGDADTARPAGGVEGAALINGGIHAREWQSPESVTAVIERLAANANDAGFHQFILENLTTVILPVLNVDGFLQTQRFPDRVTAHEQQPREGRMRRKNLRHPTATTVDEDILTTGDNFFGVDLNRNNPVGFGQNGRSSSSTTSLIYRATAPATEPEITALRAAAALGPELRLRMYSDTHSFTQAYLISRADNSRLTQITTQLVGAMRSAGGSHYGAFTDPVAGDIGTTADYFNQTYQIPAWTLEIEPVNGASDYGGSSHVHGGFVTPDAHIARVRDEIALMYLAGLYNQAGPPSVREVQIRDDTGALLVHLRWTASGATRTLSGTTAVLRPGVQYRLWVAFDKPMRLRTPGGDVTSFGAQAINAALRAPGGTAQPIGAATTWYDTPASAADAGDGYLQYSDDAASVDFTLPAFSGSGSSLQLELTVVDLVGQRLDGDPATIADWSGGHWTGYENTAGVAGDVGGTDDTIPLAWSPTGEPPPPTPVGGGGGGGTFDALSALLLLFVALVGARRLRYARRT